MTRNPAWESTQGEMVQKVVFMGVDKHRSWPRKGIIARAMLAGSLLLGIVSGWFVWQLRSSLPELGGELIVDGITSAVTIDRDAEGIPTIRADSRANAAFALGFLHGQDRFFQMDLLRRISSGRLSELVGEVTLRNDESMRRHQFRAIVPKALAALPPQHHTVLAAYCNGVNRGLTSLKSPPPEYLILRQRPQPWAIEDSLFVVASMMCELEPSNADFKLGWTLLRERVPREVFEFLVRKGSAWDAALDDSMFDPPGIPPASVWSLRDAPAHAFNNAGTFEEYTSIVGWGPRPLDPELLVGSNNWAVAGARAGAAGRDGHSILASDMHLALTVPATWYRVVMHTPTTDGTTRRLVGVTLPGWPTLIAGSNGSIAWGLTAKHGDFGDLVELKPTEEGPYTYATPAGSKRLETHTEQIPLAGGGVREVKYESSIWGPVVSRRGGRRFVHRWIGHDHRALDLSGLTLESATSTEEALRIANTAGTPRLNFVAADDQGTIGWTIMGRLPRRTRAVEQGAVDWSRESGDWSELLPPEDYPRVLNPSNGRIWTANNRVLGEDYLKLAGYGDYDPGARARQIRDRLRARDAFDERQLLDIQLDDAANFLERWRQLLLKTAQHASQPLSDACLEHVQRWGGRAAVDSVGYRVVYDFRRQVIDAILGLGPPPSGRATNALRKDSLANKLRLRGVVVLSYEDVAWQLLEERPPHWLPSQFASWDELLSLAAKATETQLTRDQPLAAATWGQRNTVLVQHPLSIVAPLLAKLLDMPVRQLPGDTHMPRVQGPGFGASQRMVVSPGREEAGIYHQPGGASGHFLSPFYRTGFDDWAAGNPSPLLPGPRKYQLTLRARADL